MSLKPGSQVAELYSEMSKGMGNSLDTHRSQNRPGMLQLAYIHDQLGTKDGKENSKTLVLSLATVSESTEKGREEDSFKMSFSPKDDSSVHLFHLSSIKSPKLNHSLTDKQTPLKQENTKMCISISDSSCPVDGVKYNHYTDADYGTEGSSTCSMNCGKSRPQLLGNTWSITNTLLSS